MVTSGGGVDGRQLLEAALRALALKRLDVAALVVTGPLLADADRRALGQLAERLPNVTLRSFEPDLGRYLAAADLVVCMAGYSSIAEVLAHRRRSIVVPRVKPWPEQRVRAERLARLGLIATIHPDALTPERLRAEIVRSLAAPPPPHTVDCDGARRSAAAIDALLRGNTPA
ncbi:MAG: glycosyltransferase [Thermomicrobiales bacterium]